MDAFKLLEKDHREVEDIFAKLEETGENAVKTREQLFQKLKTELDIHTEIEEKILYPRLKEIEETRDITFEGYEEHHVAKILLEELSQMSVDSEEWTAKLKVLKENIEHHVEEEEDEMFVDARKKLTEEEVEDLGERLEAGKKRLAASAGM